MLAYIDSLTAGLVPCKVLAVEENGGLAPHFPTIALTIVVKVTADRGCYRRGDVERLSPRLAVPRTAVYRSRQACGAYRIRAYDWRGLLTDMEA